MSSAIYLCVESSQKPTNVVYDLVLSHFIDEWGSRDTEVNNCLMLQSWLMVELRIIPSHWAPRSLPLSITYTDCLSV